MARTTRAAPLATHASPISTPPVIVCQEGYQSSLAASDLHDLGFLHATDLEGGFEAWRAQGLPIEAPGVSSS
jgi:rhodanese-related sulfurtransferase